MGISPIVILLCFAFGAPFNRPFILIFIPLRTETEEFKIGKKTFFRNDKKNLCFLLFLICKATYLDNKLAEFCL